ncbi:hypothetical protein CWE09_06470 [Aliidiomarina minuta]|uniref:ABC transporter n=1 Tax=Aliidiomarina minuta TaxID=880057 RepID=A0A432W8A5_9GAMM|nr:VacJ family lipoprotein [Aliidiomarina minuta]RUO26350.1 hypothetical protein CWE09_06470 [Aliidiomarina minuta]
MKSWRLIFCLIGIFFVAGCSSTPDNNEQEEAGQEFEFGDERDPFEEFNRRMWSLNRNILDPFFITPAANVYSKTPQPVRRGIYNMTENLTEPPSVVNNLLQGKPKSAVVSVGRFVVNSTVGLLGFFDVATHMGLEQDRETFGETLAVYGTPDGPYVMLPGLGPTVVIDRGGDFVDELYSPTMYLNFYVNVARFALRGLEQRIQLQEVEGILENSLDEYSFVRETYFSYWQDKVYDGDPPREDRWDQDYDDDWDDWDDDGWESGEDAFAWQLIKRDLQVLY